MKKLLLITILMFGALSMQAQEFHFGAKLGGALTNLSISGQETDVLTPSSKFGFYVGVVGEYMFNDQFAIAPELEISTAGANFEGDDEIRAYGTTTTINYDGQYKLMYLNIPVMFKYYVNENMSLDFGPQLGFLLSAKADLDYSYKTVLDSDGSILDERSESTKDEDVKEELNSTDFGLNIGATYKMESGLFFNARYTLGLSNIAKDSSDNPEIKNTAIKFGIGYFFN